MKMKSLVLGAAGIMAATGAQAADLPVAPEPVDYVRVCDAYGAGFYYIPGTETCLKIGGRIRAEYRIWDNPNGRKGNDSSTRARAYLFVDSRTNTEYGLLRTFIDAWWTSDSYMGTGANVTLWHAFIQFGGLTAGRTTSFFDFYTGDTFESVFDLAQSDRKLNLLAYTAAFGNGFSASLSVEDGTSRRHNVYNLLTGNNAYGGHRYPDFVANLRVDQGWGSAQLSAALHDVRDGVGASDDSEMGWAVQAGVTFNLPMVAAGDSVSFQAAYSEGATDYTTPSLEGGALAFDAIRRPTGTFELTKAWSVSGGFTHYWTPEVSTAFTASYVDVDNWGKVFDTKELDLQGNIVWSPVSGFLIGAEIEYANTDYAVGSDQDTWVGMLRLQRTY